MLSARDRLFGHEGKRFDAYFWFVGWDCVSLGVTICASLPNVEVHLPFGFIRIGRSPLAAHAAPTTGEPK
jgi:hypothetical protein